MLPRERKRVEPMATRTAPARMSAKHQLLLHFIRDAAWSDEDVLAKVREMVLPSVEKNGPIEAWIIDDASFPRGGQALGRRAPPILRPTRQGRSIASRAVAVDRQLLCRRNGPRAVQGRRRQACRSRSSSRPGHRLHCSRSARPARPACRAASR
ncbi:transposase [Bradyrhizobium cosmicum]|uniref:transposase n=1 Tax=Bradyrhizobium cosmicum TaxID=1404864 RepID=UPI0039656A15